MNLLLAEDDRVVRITVLDALEEAGYHVTECADGPSALRAAEGALYDLVLSDVRMPGLGGIELFRRLRKIQPAAAVLLMTAYADTDDAVAVMREGARDYLVKPFETDELLLRLGRVCQDIEVRRQLEVGGALPVDRPRHSIIGTSAATRNLLQRIEAAAGADLSVIITGETGTGKDLCARTIHERSRRAGKPFVAVNCAAIPENLLESELFGHEKGAFTGADRKRTGRLEAASGGTLFLDEVGELPVAHQAKVLRAIDTSSFEPVGSNRSVRVDVRVISATNCDLRAAMQQKLFRSDLFFRLNGFPIHTPPLRERRDDIPLLVADLLQEISARNQQPLPGLDPCCVAALATYDFPGNVRELIHALEHAVAMARGDVIRLEHLPADFGSCGCEQPAGARGEVEPLASSVRKFERQYIRQVLAKAGRRRARAASLLGISRKGLWQKLRGDPK